MAPVCADDPSEGAYRNTALVRASSALSSQEQSYLSKRLPITKKALEDALDMTLEDDEVPRIAFCLSGGGYRAMIASMGHFIGAKQLGLMDASTYIGSVSGSTWLMAPWMAIGGTIEEYLERLITKVAIDMRARKIDVHHVTRMLLKKFLFNQSISLIDLYGAVLANTLLLDFGDDKLSVTLSPAQERLADGSWPYPIYTAVEAGPTYEWFEFTPYEVGSDFLSSYVPTQSFGSQFENGISHAHSPEPSLGYLMGIFGSFLSANFKEIYTELYNDLLPGALKNIVEDLLSNPLIGTQRVFPAKVANFHYKMLTSPWYWKRELTLVDAGLAFNLPIPALLRRARKVDIIVICDATSSSKGIGNLYAAEKYARKKGLKFPTITVSNVSEQSMYVFKDATDPTVPTVIYFPLICTQETRDAIQDDLYFSSIIRKDFDVDQEISKGYCRMMNCVYSEAQVRELSGLAQFNVLQNQDALLAEIKEVIVRKQIAKLPVEDHDESSL